MARFIYKADDQTVQLEMVDGEEITAEQVSAYALLEIADQLGLIKQNLDPVPNDPY